MFEATVFTNTYARHFSEVLIAVKIRYTNNLLDLKIRYTNNSLDLKICAFNFCRTYYRELLTAMKISGIMVFVSQALFSSAEVTNMPLVIFIAISGAA